MVEISDLNMNNLKLVVAIEMELHCLYKILKKYPIYPPGLVQADGTFDIPITYKVALHLSRVRDSIFHADHMLTEFLYSGKYYKKWEQLERLAKA